MARRTKSVDWNRQEFLKALERLPREPKPSLQETWEDWVKHYNRGRLKKKTLARTIYNRLQQPSWIFWLAEASGINNRLVQRAKNLIASGGVSQTQAKNVRNILDWELVARRLEQTADLANGSRSPPKQIAGYHSLSGTGDNGPTKSEPQQNSPGAADRSYSRYVAAYEVEITPAHDTLQKRFERFILTNGAMELRRNVAGVDLRYRNATKGTILVEIKPCKRVSARYAIRTAIGQLLDYKQRWNGQASLLIVLETKPLHEDRLLATSNGFGIAYPTKGAFEVLWPKR